jgi:transmembrane sensor
MDKQSLHSLLDKYLKGQTTPEEDVLLEQWYNSKLEEETTWTLHSPHEKKELENSLLHRLKMEVAASENEIPVVALNNNKRFLPWVAAAIILIIAGGWYLNNIFSERKNNIAVNTSGNDVAPGSSRATLRLADGSVIILNDTHNGIIAEQGSANITKLSDGELSYVLAKNTTGKSVINTMSTPRGGQYQLRLPDGSKVWLNSSSSITFPTIFDNKNREVTITGEAYFEIAKNARQPFFVNANHAIIEVLGTNFNVNAYADEPTMNTTLLEGSVRVSGVILVPGQQAKIKDQSIKIEKVNTEQVVSWKNGSFNFEDTDLKTVLRQLARWYDVVIEYRGNVPDMNFGGEIGRSLTLSQVLEILEKSGVSFKIEGNKLIVFSK